MAFSPRCSKKATGALSVSWFVRCRVKGVLVPVALAVSWQQIGKARCSAKAVSFAGLGFGCSASFGVVGKSRVSVAGLSGENLYQNGCWVFWFAYRSLLLAAFAVLS